MAASISMRILRWSVILLVALSSAAGGTDQSKLKRQIYREQVLPSSGGKIPDGAFSTDRLALNRLNKAGISVPDGVLLEHRHVYAHPHSNQHDPEDEDSLVRVVQKTEDRYVPPEGTYHNERPLTVSSTYIIRKPTHATNIRTPHEQMPLHEYLAGKQADVYGAYPTIAFPANGWRPFAFEAIPPPVYGKPIRPQYQPAAKPSVAYYPVTVPLEIPNRNLKGRYYQPPPPPPPPRQQRLHAEDVHGVVDWPYILGEYMRLADEISVVGQRPYGHAAEHSLFFTPEVIAPLEAYYYGTKERYARKSKEVAFVDHTTDSLHRLKAKEAAKVVKLQCIVGSENAVDGHDAKCRLRY